MNIKLITRALELSDDDWELVTKLRALSEAERELLMTALGPRKPATRKSSKRAGKKSQRAQSLGEQIQRRPRGVVTGDSDDDSRFDNAQGQVAREEFLKDMDDGPCAKCGKGADDNAHHKRTMPDFHPFTPAASSAPPPSDQASSEIGKDGAGNVHRAAGSGD